MSIGTKITTLLKGKCVGVDMFGNRYYVSKGAAKKRWVMYNGIAEASKVPPMWHAWLHYMMEELPSETETPYYEWQQEHQPNLTGTKFAYKPKGDLKAGGKRTASSSDYEAWIP